MKFLKIVKFVWEHRQLFAAIISLVPEARRIIRPDIETTIYRVREDMKMGEVIEYPDNIVDSAVQLTYSILKSE